MEKKPPAKHLKPNLIKLDSGKCFNANLSELKASILDMKSKQSLMKEYIFLLAELTRARYNALINEGFSEKQAIELSKTLF